MWRSATSDSVNGSSVQASASASSSHASCPSGMTNGLPPKSGSHAASSGAQRGQRERAGAEFDAGDRERVAVFDEALVERAEQGDQQRRQRADRNAEAHRGRHAADHQRDAGQHRDAEQQFAHEKRRLASLGSISAVNGVASAMQVAPDRRVGELDRAVEREPVQRDQHADAGVGADEARPASRAARARCAAAARARRPPAACATRPAAARGSVISLPRMAVKPHSTTQKWICNCALAVGDRLVTAGDPAGDTSWGRIVRSAGAPRHGRIH